MRCVVSSDVAHPIAARGRTLDQLFTVFAATVNASERHVAATGAAGRSAKMDLLSVDWNLNPLLKPLRLASKKRNRS